MLLLKTLLKQLFNHDVHPIEKKAVVYGYAALEHQPLHILGVKESTFFGAEQALIMAERVLEILETQSLDPVLLLVDVKGQQLSMRDEWLGMHQYFAHLLECLDCLRQQGNKLVSLAYNEAVGGGYIAFGLMADTILALPDADLAVMWLEGIAKVTKIELSTLEELSKTLPVFAPGAKNYYKLGGLHDIVPLSALREKILLAFQDENNEDNRARLGKERGGRQWAFPIINKIRDCSCY